MRRPRYSLLPALLALLFLQPAAAWGQGARPAADAGRQPIQATDLFKIRQLEDVVVAPGGRSVVYTVKRVVERPDSAGGPAYRTHLWRVDADGRSAPRQLTFGEKSAYSPSWHPDGDRLAFVRADADGTPQVFVLPTTGGEAYQLTDARHGASAPAFSPDGRQLLFASRLPESALRSETGDAPAYASERPGRRRDDTRRATPNPDGSPSEVRAYLAEERDVRPRVLDRLDFQGERDLEPTLAYRHLFAVRVPPGPPAGDGFPEATRVTSGFASFSGGSWMPSSDRVVVSGLPEPSYGAERPHPDRVRDRDLFVAPIDGPGQTPLLSMEGYALSAPRVSPDGGHVAFGARRLDDAGYAQGEIGLYRIGGDAPARLLTEDFDRSVGAAEWAPDGWRLYATAPSEGAFPLYRLSPFSESDRRRAQMRAAVDTTAAPDTTTMTPADTAAAAAPDPEAVSLSDEEIPAPAAVERVTDARRGVRAFAVGRNSLFYVATEPENPFELYIRSGGAGSETAGGGARRLTGHNAAWLAERRLSMPEPFEVGSDSFSVDGWVMRPTTQRKGTPAPLLVEIHGGPMAMWGPGEATMWHEFQLMAARGYAVVYSNPRGSGGYGIDFKRGNYRDWGRGPTRDVLAAADYAAALDWTDAGRQVVTGGSYAGYLTAWIVSQTDRFEAAVAQRGVYDLATFLGEGNAWRLVPYHFGGFPWDAEPEDADAGTAPVIAEGGLDGSGPPDPGTAAEAETAPRFASAREALIQNSPITYVEQIRTPLLIMHADEDLRTGVIQSEMLYRSLKVLGRPVEYVRYPDAGHDLSRTGDPAQRLDRMLRIWEFFERYV